jgi:hypothetical protein
METRSPSLLREVGPDEVFNLPLYEHHLVIDLRPSQMYSQGHMATAVSFPRPPLECVEADREIQLIEFVRSYVREFMRPENPSPILLYGDDTADTKFHAEWLAARLGAMQRERKTVATYAPEELATVSIEDPRFDYFEHFCLTIADHAKEIWILRCSYEEFAAKYGFLCGDVDFETMDPLPHRISEHIFLGSRVIPLTKKALSTLGITHMIVSKHQELDWAELHDLSVLTCDVRDCNSQAMMECWTASVQFIREAELRGGRVLVMLFGRSRSTSIVLAYLIMNRGLSLCEAWQVVHSKCWHLIDKSLAFEDQLREWEGGNCSDRTLSQGGCVPT